MTGPDESRSAEPDRDSAESQPSEDVLYEDRESPISEGDTEILSRKARDEGGSAGPATNQSPERKEPEEVGVEPISPAQDATPESEVPQPEEEEWLSSDLELPEDELLDLPESENSRVVFRSDSGDEALPSRTDTVSESDEIGGAGEIGGRDEISGAGVIGESPEAVEAPWTAVEEEPPAKEEAEHCAQQPFPTEEDEQQLPELEPLAGEAEEGGTWAGENVALEEPPGEAELGAEAGPAAESEWQASQGGVAEASASSEATLAEEAETPLAEAAEEEPDILLVSPPGEERWFPLSELVIHETGQPLGEAAARWITRLYLQSLTSEGEEAEEVGDTATDAGAFFPQLEAEPGDTDYRERLRRTRPKKPFLQELLGIVLGGLGGLLIAYYALNFFGGPRYDFARLPLPGIRHTYKHTPPWLRDIFRGEFPWSSGGSSSDVDQSGTQQGEPVNSAD